jgi:TRAP-type C4-dicarboxylate transport system permease small subunit
MISKIRWFINNFEEFFAALVLLSMAMLAFANVLTRYFFNYSLAFTEELEVTGMVWLTLFGVSAAFKREMHLRLMYLDRWINARTQIIFHLTSLGMSFILFSVLGYLSLFHIKEVIELEITTEALEMPEWLYLLIIPLGCLFINLRLIELALGKIKTLTNN